MLHVLHILLGSSGRLRAAAARACDLSFSSKAEPPRAMKACSADSVVSPLRRLLVAPPRLIARFVAELGLGEEMAAVLVALGEGEEQHEAEQATSAHT